MVAGWNWVSQSWSLCIHSENRECTIAYVLHVLYMYWIDIKLFNILYGLLMLCGSLNVHYVTQLSLFWRDSSQREVDKNFEYLIL